MDRDINWYMDTAKKNAGIKSDRKLAAALELSTVSKWRDPYRHVVPEQSAMVRLANMAGIPQEIALIERDIWEANFKAPETVPFYENIKKALKETGRYAAVIAIATIEILPNITN